MVGLAGFAPAVSCPPDRRVGCFATARWKRWAGGMVRRRGFAPLRAGCRPAMLLLHHRRVAVGEMAAGVGIAPTSRAFQTRAHLSMPSSVLCLFLEMVRAGGVAPPVFTAGGWFYRPMRHIWQSPHTRCCVVALLGNGRAGGICTRGLLLPKQARWLLRYSPVLKIGPRGRGCTCTGRFLRPVPLLLGYTGVGIKGVGAGLTRPELSIFGRRLIPVGWRLPQIFPRGEAGRRRACSPSPFGLDPVSNGSRLACPVHLPCFGLKSGCPRWTRTIIAGFKDRCPTFRRQGIVNGLRARICTLTTRFEASHAVCYITRSF